MREVQSVSPKAEAAPSFYRPRATTLDNLRAVGRIPETAKAPRAAQRPKIQFPKKGKAFLAKSLVVIVLFVAIVWAKNRITEGLQNAAGLRLAQVKVGGVHYLETDEVLEAAGLPLGENMYKLDLKGAAKRVAKMGWVDKVFLERRLPRTLVISIRERKPVAILDSFSLYGLDREGRVLPTSPSLADEDLPLVSGVEVYADAVGTTRLAERVKDGLDFLIFLGKKDRTLARDVSEVCLSEDSTLKVTFLDGVEVKFGPVVTELELKRMAAVLGDLGAKGQRAAAMDFRYRDSVFVKTRD